MKILFASVGVSDIDFAAENVGKAVLRARRADKAPGFAYRPYLRQTVDVTEDMMRFDFGEGKPAVPCEQLLSVNAVSVETPT